MNTHFVRCIIWGWLLKVPSRHHLHFSYDVLVVAVGFVPIDWRLYPEMLINPRDCRLVEVPMRLFQHLGWQVFWEQKWPERWKLKLAKWQKRSRLTLEMPLPAIYPKFGQKKQQVVCFHSILRMGHSNEVMGLMRGFQSNIPMVLSVKPQRGIAKVVFPQWCFLSFLYFHRRRLISQIVNFVESTH